MKINLKLSITIALIAIVIYFKGVEVQAVIGATLLQSFLFANNFFFFSLFGNGFTYDQNDDSILPVLDMGYFNMLKLKLIYVSRYIGRDQFLFNDYANNILEDIDKRLSVQFKENNWDLKKMSEIPVPTVDFSEVESVPIYEKFVKKGIPFVVKNVPSRAAKTWNPAYFAEKYGKHSISVINTTDVEVLQMTMSEYVESQQEGNNNGALYIRALSDIFDDYPELIEDVGYKDFDKIMPSHLITAQIFMGMSKGTGTSYHCANYNNLFFQIDGRKKWTFVSPRYNPLMYPMFNEKSMDVASFVTVFALNDEEVMEKFYPLYKFAPKMVAVLEPGDVLFNPPWQWHMIDNLEVNSIGVASRWLLAKDQHYQNTVHSTLQFLRKYIWKTYYTKLVNLKKGVRAHSASNTPPMDERLNFGKEGSAKSYFPRIFPEAAYLK